MMNKGFVLWFSGADDADRAMVAEAVEESLLERGLDVELLHYDWLLAEFGANTPEHLPRRAALIANLLARNGVVALVAVKAPLRRDREQARAMIGPFLEAYLPCPVCAQTSPDADFEPPTKAEIELDRETLSCEDRRRKALLTLEVLGWIPGGQGGEYSGGEEEEIKKRLKDLGYL